MRQVLAGFVVLPRRFWKVLDQLEGLDSDFDGLVAIQTPNRRTWTMAPSDKIPRPTDARIVALGYRGSNWPHTYIATSAFLQLLEAEVGTEEYNEGDFVAVSFGEDWILGTVQANNGKAFLICPENACVPLRDLFVLRISKGGTKEWFPNPFPGNPVESEQT